MSASGKVCVVFGAARGAGEACATRLLKEGTKGLCIADVQAELGAATCKKLEVTYPGRVIFVACDVTDDKQIEAVFSAAVEKFGIVEITVNAAAIVDEINWKRTLNINLNASISLTYIAQQRMGTQNGNKGGHLILFSSIAGVLPFNLLPVYTATKWALVGFVRSMGCEEGLQADGVRVNAILPNSILDTPFRFDAVAIPRYPNAQAQYDNLVKDLAKNGITSTMVADALDKLLVEEKQHNGATIMFTKEGIQPFDESERTKKISDMLHVNTSGAK